MHCRSSPARLVCCYPFGGISCREATRVGGHPSLQLAASRKVGAGGEVDMQDRITVKVLAATGVVVALCVAGCSDNVSGQPGNGPAVPTFSGSVTQPSLPPGTVSSPASGSESAVPPPASDPP